MVTRWASSVRFRHEPPSELDRVMRDDDEVCDSPAAFLLRLRALWSQSWSSSFDLLAATMCAWTKPGFS